MPEPLSDDQADQFMEQLDRDGFFVWRGLLPESLVDAHLAGFEGILAELPKRFPGQCDPDGRAPQRLVNGELGAYHAEHEPTQALCFRPALLDFARRRFKAEPVLRNPFSGLYSLAAPPGAPNPSHTDTLNTAAPDPWEAELRVWGALEDIDPDSGPLYFYPGSHRLISRAIREDVLTERPDFIAILENLPARFTPATHYPVIGTIYAYTLGILDPRAAALGLTKTAPTLRKGDAVIFQPSIVHGTLPPMNRRLTRKHLIFNLAAMDTVYYGMTSYWGALFDRRDHDPGVRYPIAQTRHGWRVEQYMETLARHFSGRDAE